MSIRFPAEWESCEAVWVAWPHRESTWPGHFDKIPAAMVRLIHEIARWVPVRILVGSEHHETCRRLVPPSAAIELISIETNDCWIRDYGPTFAFRNDSLVGIDWKFNA
ncbi:MAG: agmatine deiminase family protein, partial [Planctomycetota bacterium]